MQQINLQASKIAACVGMNPYVTITDTIYDIFKLKNKGPIEKLELTNMINEEEKQSITRLLNISSESSTKEIQTEFMKNLNNLATNDKDSELFLERLDNNSVKQTIKSEINMRKGVLNEKKDLDRLEKKENIKITQRNSQFGNLVINISDVYKIIISGRTDGYNEEEQCIIETKHRKNRLFGKVPVYERVQCEIYMRMFECSKCYHTETFREESNETLLEMDDKLWKQILDGLQNKFMPEYIEIMECASQ